MNTTSIIPSNFDPRWSETFILQDFDPKHLQTSSLKIVVVDIDRAQNEHLLGEVDDAFLVNYFIDFHLP